MAPKRSNPVEVSVAAFSFEEDKRDLISHWLLHQTTWGVEVGCKEWKRPKKKVGGEGMATAPIVEEVKRTGEDTKKLLFQQFTSAYINPRALHFSLVWFKSRPIGSTPFPRANVTSYKGKDKCHSSSRGRGHGRGRGRGRNRGCRCEQSGHFKNTHQKVRS
ncbi:hypothetical protein J1N35_036739 [Gossypium stocksii]|uniref:Uncharacterized protein n=1 Tax=Gossypium stocksii TaxID=47602 RepID=A0A9D3UIL2_9ROSI|nr:hypothetical protein J1N35_036739 [Gossypium stocksii]